MYRIFIVEDDATIANIIRNKIVSWGHEAKIAENLHDVMAEFAAFNPHLVLMDITLPFFNGYHWCTQIRKVSEVPIVFLSSAADNMNIVMAMNMGGDDFLAKPVDLEVMMAKLTAMLRRTYDMGGQLPVLEHRGMMLSLTDATVTYQQNKVELTKNEFRILQTLMEKKGHIVSRDELMMRLWQMDAYVEENTLTVNVNHLRKKLEGIGLTDLIITKVGVGYLIPVD